jgi:hypothetical protein
MIRFLRHLAFLTFLWSISGGPPAHAQYPAGYGGYGWHGWGGGTPAGHTAAGLGVFGAGAGQAAAGVGQGNEETAQARSINAQTAMGVNNYVWECQQRNTKDYYAMLARQQQQNVDAWDAIRQRILNNPTESDIAHGDTLNAILDEITNPKVYFQTLQRATMPIPSATVKRIPFNYASAALTYSLTELTNRETVPATFLDPAFAAERQSLRSIATQLKKEANEQGHPKPETIKAFRAGLDRVKATLETQTQPETDDRINGEKYLKALYGLTRMLDSPSYDVYLAAVDKLPSVPLSEVLTFMHAFNLRFGPTKTPEDREMYSQLYGALSQLRQTVQPPTDNLIAASNNGPTRDNRVTDYFGGMSYNHVNPPPPPPRP